MTPRIESVFIPNRGEIAVRVIRTCRKLGVRTVLGTSDVDRGGLAAELADRVVVIGSPRNSYLNLNAVMSAAIGCDVDALHPGYGFLAEDPALSRACDEAGIIFLGPTADTIRALGNKLAARDLAHRAEVPLLPGSEQVESLSAAEKEADRIGFPLLVKAAAGGGGRGMRIVTSRGELPAALAGARAEAQSAFGDSTLYLERYVDDGLHIEIQLLGDISGRVAALGDRDCSIQRRHQKLIEEAPAWRVPEAGRRAMADAAVALAESAAYRGLGTAEFIYDRGRDQFYFLEVNSRIQVEHPVTEETSGLDLVELQLAVGNGGHLEELDQPQSIERHSIELRINAEDPDRNFAPSPGRLSGWSVPAGPGVRMDTHCRVGDVVSPFYDSMLGKLIVSDRDRLRATHRALVALDEMHIEGAATTVPLHQKILSDPGFIAGEHNTAWLEQHLLPRVNNIRQAPVEES